MDYMTGGVNEAGYIAADDMTYIYAWHNETSTQSKLDVKHNQNWI